MKKITATFFVLNLLIINTANADHRSRDRGISTSHLDDDIVEEIPIPVLFGVEYDDLIPDFGDPRGGGTREHEGQDMMVPKGTPIVSPTEAVVLRTGTGVSAGKYVYTRNPGGETFRYMHLDYIADIESGDKLDKGDFIGTVGDTGNALAGSYHLHFEIRDEDNDATDPYPRLDGDFSERDIESAIKDIFSDISNDKEYATFLLTEFPDEIKSLVKEGVDLPRALENVLDDEGVSDQIDAEAKLVELLKTIPVAVNTELEVGDMGATVTLIQIYLLYLSEGPELDRLAAVGATGYYGSITASAIEEYQLKNDLPVTGVYDRGTRLQMIK